MLEEDATKLKLFKKIQGDIEGDSINDNWSSSQRLICEVFRFTKSI
jgi:hypothetical protein